MSISPIRRLSNVMAKLANHNDDTIANDMYGEATLSLVESRE